MQPKPPALDKSKKLSRAGASPTTEIKPESAESTAEDDEKTFGIFTAGQHKYEGPAEDGEMTVPVIKPNPEEKPAKKPELNDNATERRKSSSVLTAKTTRDSRESVSRHEVTGNKQAASWEDSWVCECGFRNVGRYRCENCNRLNPNKQMYRKLTSTATGTRANNHKQTYWFCSCGYRNEGQRSYCASCGKNRLSIQ